MVEMLVVLAVLGAVFGVGLAVFDASRIATSQAARRMANTVTQTRFEAIRSNGTALMEISTADQGSYRVCLDDDADGACDEAELLRTVVFGEDNSAGVVLTAATLSTLGFDRRGLPIATGSGEFTLENVNGTMKRTITFTAAGDVEVE